MLCDGSCFLTACPSEFFSAQVDEAGMTSLHHAAYMGQVKLLRLMLEQRPEGRNRRMSNGKIILADDSGRNGLHIAAGVFEIKLSVGGSQGIWRGNITLSDAEDCLRKERMLRQARFLNSFRQGRSKDLDWKDCLGG